MRESLTVSPILELHTHGYKFHEVFRGLREFRTLLVKIVCLSLTYNTLFFITEFDMIKPL